MELITDWIRAAVEGVTVDGRSITEQQLTQMSQSYDPAVYNARIFKEHVRGISSDSQFKPLGDVVAVKAEAIRGSALNGKTALFVKIAPSPELITLVRSGEKVHLSIEMDTNFSDTNQAYLVGLGVTDTPASLGTEIMKFNQQERRKNLFSAPIELSQQTTPQQRLPAYI